MTTKQYPIVCPSCRGRGFITTQGLTTSSSKICPACNGNKVVIVTETTDDWLQQIKEIISKNPL